MKKKPKPRNNSRSRLDQAVQTLMHDFVKKVAKTSPAANLTVAIAAIAEDADGNVVTGNEYVKYGINFGSAN